MKQWPQGLWVVTAEGKVLGFHYYRAKSGESYSQGQKRWVTETIAMVDSALKAAGSLSPREVKSRPDPFPDRGQGTTAAGGARLAVTVIGLMNGHQEGPPVVDSIHLDAEAWAALCPADGKATVGSEWTIPESVARRFTPALSPMTDSIFSPTPDDATTAKISAKVERVENGIVVIRYTAKWATSHNRDGDPRLPIRTTASGEGVGVLDTNTGKLTAMEWILNGTFRNSPPADRARPTAAVIEWSRGR